MKIFGHPWIMSEKFYVVMSKEDILQTAPNSMITIGSIHQSSMRELAWYCQENGLRYSLEVKSMYEAIFANLMGCTFAICDSRLAQELMPIAQNYLFDMQVLVYAEEHNDTKMVESLAKIGVDGLIYREAFVVPSNL
jgi:hypothetical protein